MKKKYCKPSSELIQMDYKESILRFSLQNKENWMKARDTQVERNSGSIWNSAPHTHGNMAVDAGEDIPGASKTNPWDSWD